MTATIPVFVVEDEEAIRQLLKDALADGGFVVTAVDNGEEAMAVLAVSGTEFRAVITDINLPGALTGWDVARHAREVNDQIPVIYMTGESAHEWASKGVPNSQLLTKPFAVAQVVTAVSQLINAATIST